MTEVVIVGDDVSTDAIIPGRYAHLTDPAELGVHLFENLRPAAPSITPGLVLMAGANFGCGSVRERAPLAIQGAGIDVVIAKSYARVFYRNAINLGLRLYTCAEAVTAAGPESRVVADPATGVVRVDGRSFRSLPLGAHLEEILRDGGLVEWVRHRVGGKESAK